MGISSSELYKLEVIRGKELADLSWLAVSPKNVLRSQF